MDWHLYRDGVQSGPFSEQELFKMGFDYGSLRDAVKQLLHGYGWKLKTVIMKGKASY